MSMLTGQSDKLRKAALIQEEHVHYNMALADDTILSLRYRVRELRAENVKLQAENERLTETLRGAESEADRLTHEAAELLIESAKLRELVTEMFNACPMCVNCAHNHLTVGWYDRMRELGIEV